MNYLEHIVIASPAATVIPVDQVTPVMNLATRAQRCVHVP